MEFTPGQSAGLLIAGGLAGAILAMILLVKWARRRGSGAVAAGALLSMFAPDAGALLSMFAPDPTFEKNIRLAEEAKQEQHEEDEQGEDKDPATP
jgi:hypothetical protein